jgi:hypothetical protein
MSDWADLNKSSCVSVLIFIARHARRAESANEALGSAWQVMA